MAAYRQHNGNLLDQYTFPFLRLLGASEGTNPCPRLELGAGQPIHLSFPPPVGSQRKHQPLPPPRAWGGPTNTPFLSSACWEPAKTPTLAPASSLGRANQYTFPFLRSRARSATNDTAPFLRLRGAESQQQHSFPRAHEIPFLRPPRSSPFLRVQRSGLPANSQLASGLTGELASQPHGPTGNDELQRSQLTVHWPGSSLTSTGGRPPFSTGGKRASQHAACPTPNG